MKYLEHHLSIQQTALHQKSRYSRLHHHRRSWVERSSAHPGTETSKMSCHINECHLSSVELNILKGKQTNNKQLVSNKTEFEIQFPSELICAYTKVLGPTNNIGLTFSYPTWRATWLVYQETFKKPVFWRLSTIDQCFHVVTFCRTFMNPDLENTH